MCGQVSLSRVIHGLNVTLAVGGSCGLPRPWLLHLMMLLPLEDLRLMSTVLGLGSQVWGLVQCEMSGIGEWEAGIKEWQNAAVHVVHDLGFS